MKKTGFLISCVLFTIFSLPSCQNTSNQSTISRPKLVVGIVVDQMRWDYLYRYYDRYGDGGFKRLLNSGFSCENTFINYLPSATAVGHSVIYTGSVPAIDGIVANTWVNQLTGERVYCTDDHTVETVGASGDAGKMSPRNLLVSTITDQLRLATNFRSRVVGVALKDRASILPAGHTANGAFWFDDASGQFITSTYYMDTLPDWVRKFNAENNPEKLVKDGWTTLHPIETYKQSTPDNVPWEGKMRGEENPVFPHDLKNLYQNDHGSIRTSPFGNTLTLNFAKAAINGYNLGGGEFTDFLTVSCSSTDYVGHKYGPNSIEAEDSYLRLDKQLASFFYFLDQKVGKGNYLVFLTADHGTAHTIGFMKKHQLPSGALSSKQIINPLNNILSKKFGVNKLVKSFRNYRINYYNKKISDNNLNFEAIKKVTVSYLRKQPGIQTAVDMDQVGVAPVPEPLKIKIMNSYYYKRCGPVVVIPDPGWFKGHRKSGTTHGNWNPYDTHIPLIFMGWNISHGATNRHVRMSDISPTVASLLHIQMPNGNVGTPITEILETK